MYFVKVKIAFPGLKNIFDSPATLTNRSPGLFPGHRKLSVGWETVAHLLAGAALWGEVICLFECNTLAI